MKLIYLAISLLACVVSYASDPHKKFLKEENFVFIPSGQFSIEFDRVQTVSVNAFYMSKTEVTNLEYRTFLLDLKKQNRMDEYQQALPDTAAWRIDGTYNEPMVEHYFSHPAFDHFPVVNISLEGATLYCEWLTEKYQSLYGSDFLNQCRIPSAHEWAYAARAGKDCEYSWGTNFIYNAKGEAMGNLTQIGDERISFQNGQYIVVDRYKNSEGIAGSLNDAAYMLAPAESYQPNDFGLYNMCGNAAELVFYEEALGTDLPSAIIQNRAIGGSWFSTGYDARISSVELFEKANPFTGFRVVISLI